MNKKQFIGGLNPLPKDERDFSYDTVFGSASLEELPKEDFFVSEPMEIKDQDINYPSDFCSAYAAASVSEDQEFVKIVPEYTFAKAHMPLGVDSIKEWGLNLRQICKAGCDYGFLERQYDPHHCDTDRRPERDFLTDWRNWSEELDMLAAEHRKNTFFKVDGPFDTFDNFRSVLFKNRAERRSIITGATWRRSWSEASGGFIDSDTYDPTEPGTGHAFKVFGQMKTRGKIWLVAQLSGGIETGDKGIFYFSREVVNKEFLYGAYTFKDMPKEKAEYHNTIGARVDESVFKKAFKLFLYTIKRLLTKKS